jgi:glycerol-3-phosphate dehydrogenase
MRPAWTAGAALPGGDFPWDGVDQVRGELARRYPFLPEATHHRLVRAYGTLAAEMLRDARGLADMGRCFGAGLTEREVDWLMRTEWARCADDALWRRSKLGLRLTDAQVRAVEDYIAR